MDAEEARRLVNEGGWCFWTSNTKPFRDAPPEDPTVAAIRQASETGEGLRVVEFAAILQMPVEEVIAACEVLVAEGLLISKPGRYIRSA